MFSRPTHEAERTLLCFMQQYSNFKKFKTDAGSIENPISLSELLRVQLLNIFFALFTYKLYK